MSPIRHCYFPSPVASDADVREESGNSIDRRALLSGALCAGLMTTWTHRSSTGATLSERRLVIAPALSNLVGDSSLATNVWAYDGTIPGPEIRVRQGSRLRILVENQLPQETTVHWHGIRLPNNMDGVPHLTQKPIAPGETFVYEFDCRDAGTFWYHPHMRSFEQVERGLAGALIVEEVSPIQVDRDVVWVLDDWRLTSNAQLSEDFGSMMDASHAGRLGNTVTINGRVQERFSVRSGERIRLRLINTANARIFGLEFADHRPKIISLDGHPIEAHEPDNGRVVLGPGQRADIILDCRGRAGSRATVADRFYPRQQYRLIDLAYDGGPPLREAALDALIGLPSNPVASPDMKNAVRHTIEFGGGMMDPRMRREVSPDGRTEMMSRMAERMRSGAIWTINGVSITGDGHAHEPLLSLKHGGTYSLDMLNDTAWWHPMHLHGHVFRVVSRNDKPVARREWLDTVLMAPGERVSIAFVADNLGDWMFHCHILEHQQAGMMGVIRVS